LLNPLTAGIESREVLGWASQHFQR